MSRSALKQAGLVTLTFFGAQALMLAPIPRAWVFSWPEWLSLMVIYWVIALPQQIGPGIAWCVGLCFDVVAGVLLGQHALAMSIVAFLSNLLRSRLKLFPLWQQALSILVVVGFGQLSLLTTQWCLSGLTVSPLYWSSSLTSVLAWPLIYLSSRALQSRLKRSSVQHFKQA